MSLALAGCGSGDFTGPGVTTFLAGVARRGPVAPVCSPGTPCDAPLVATFTVRAGTRDVATFRSDSLGRFRLRLAAGSYLVVPAADAPILSPASQARPVTVTGDSVTTVTLDFDTGIR